MILNDRFTGKDVLFKGNRSLLLRRIPHDAKITNARANIIPVTSDGSIGPSEDDITFNNNRGDNGEALTRVNQTPGWVEIDFHRRVTLISVSGTNLDGATLQVDIGGGTFIEVNPNGAFKAPGDGDFSLTGVFHLLPGLTVNRIKLTQDAGLSLTISNVRVRNIANNVSLRIGESPPFFSQPGDLVSQQSTIEFSELLQASLSELKAEGGFFELPFNLHSDRLTRLELEINIELLNQQQVLPPGINEVQLPFAYNAVSESKSNKHALSIPVGARIVSEGTGVKIEGSFANSKIVFGSFDELDNDLQLVDVDSGITQAQAFIVAASATASLNNQQQDVAVDGIDLLLTSVSQQVTLQLDLRADLDGKPDNKSLLSQVEKFNIDIDNVATPTWTNIALNAPITLLLNNQDNNDKRYWLLIQSLDGAAQWSVGASKLNTFAGLQQSKDGGMSWRETTVSNLEGRPEAQFRLRQNSETFHIPVEVKIGSNEQAKRLNLAQFEPLGQINFALNSEQLSNTINEFLQDSEQLSCPQGEQLANSEFELELDLNVFTLVSWEHTGGSIQPVGSPLSGITLSDDTLISGLSQTVPAVANCHYELATRAIISGADSRIELIWSGDSCDPIRTDELILLEKNTQSSFGLLTPVYSLLVIAPDIFTPVYRLRVIAPELATQVEVRLITPSNSSAFFDSVSLIASPQAIANFDLQEINKSGFVGWTILPENAFENNILNVRFFDGALQITNSSTFLQPAALSQSIDLVAKKQFDLTFNGTSTINGTAPEGFPEIRLKFSSDKGESRVNQLLIKPDSSTTHVLSGTIPESVSKAEIQLVIPRDTTLSVANVSFNSVELRDVPITFLSEAPGNLTVSDLTVGYELPQAPLPEIPMSGLCVATPADTAPGDQCEDGKCAKSDKSYCSNCRKQAVIKDAQAFRLINNQSTLIGYCENCRQPLVQNGGIPVAETTLVPIRQIDRSRLEIDDSQIALSEVDYVGKVRTQILNENGITRITQLAKADPKMLMEILEISDGLAESLVSQATKLLISHILIKSN